MTFDEKFTASHLLRSLWRDRRMAAAIATSTAVLLGVAIAHVMPCGSATATQALIVMIFIIGSVVGVFGAIAAPFDRPYLIFAGLGLWCLAFPLSTILLNIFFKKAQNGKTI